MSRSSSSVFRSSGSSRDSSTFSEYSSTDSESSHLSLAWNERDARRSISAAAASSTPLNIANLKSRDVAESPEVIDDMNAIFGQPQCQSNITSSGYDYLIVFLLVILVLIFIFFIGPSFSFSSGFFMFVFFVFLILWMMALFYSCSSNKGPVCFR